VTDKIPPQSLEAEQRVLGSMMIAGMHTGRQSDDMEAVIPEIRTTINRSMFYEEKHAVVYDFVLFLYDEGESVDIVTLSTELERKEKLDKIGGAAYLATLCEGVPTPLNAPRYAQIIREKFQLRQTISWANQLKEKAYNEVAPAVELVTSLQPHIDRMLEGESQQVNKLSEFQSSVDLYNSGESVFGIPTGFAEMDEDFFGWQKSTVITLMGRPETYKTFLMLYWAYMAYIHGYNVLIFELEMGIVKTRHRLEAFLTKINSRAIRRKSLNEDELNAYMALGDLFKQRKNDILILTRKELPVCTPAIMDAQIRKYKPDFVMLDSVLAMDVGHKVNNERERVVRNVRSIKKIMGVHEIPGLLLHHTSRDKDKHIGKTTIRAAMESDVIGQDSDIVLHIQSNKEYRLRNLAYLGVPKNRDDPARDYLLHVNMAIPLFNIEKAGVGLLEEAQSQVEKPRFAP